ncbi:MAG TPA: amidohydrolase family protein [Bryobacteraceae bacterium]|nr:amidohydrolase family protein [Bryobacteraceae bacterium]HOQ46379.1 amidohydrolase family protein [Bryobacteraceae bacterium]HPQ14249.1 amidohydrolase family protein [Bryobacteraceae bacterium]HPU72184.1 amidohydrolase family protein [Bryobacteraceae bacterium]
MKCSGINALTGRPAEVVFGKTIESVGPAAAGAADYIAPGWIDLQVNGFAGVDYNFPAAPHEEIARSIRVLFSTGVTRFYPTVITGSPEDMCGALRNLADAKERLEEGEAIEGIHVEGPHISPEDGPRGAHPKRWVRRPDLDEFRRMQEAARGLIRLVTLSPEWPEAPRYIEALVDQGVVVSIGHMNANAAQIADAVSAGATMSTHLGNGAHAVLPRHPNYLWEQLAEDRLTAGFIVDGIHLPASFLKTALRAKGPERAVLVTDAAMPAGCAPGRYKLGEQEVELTPDNRVVLAGGTRLAGSALRMDRGIENLMRLAGLTLAEAVRLATVNPARAARIEGRQKGLETGERGDVVRLRYLPETHQVYIEETWLGGEQVYSGTMTPD